MMRILIIQYRSIGNVILSTPLVRSLRLQLDNPTIIYLTKVAYRDQLIANPYIDHLVCFEKDPSECLPLLGAIDHCFDLCNDPLSWHVAKNATGQKHSFNGMYLGRWLLSTLKINLLPQTHVVDRILDLAIGLGVKSDNLGLDFFIPERDEVERNWLPMLHQGEFVVFAIHAQRETMRLPMRRMIELCDKINKPIILVGNKEDHAIGEQVADFFEKIDKNRPYEAGLSALNKKSIVFNGCGKFSFNQMASLIKQSVAVFTHDNDHMQVAAALGKDVYSIWGSSLPEFGHYPYKTKFTIFENRKIACRPCSADGKNQCPLGHFKCMNDNVFDFYLP